MVVFRSFFSVCFCFHGNGDFGFGNICFICNPIVAHKRPVMPKYYSNTICFRTKIALELSKTGFFLCMNKTTDWLNLVLYVFLLAYLNFAFGIILSKLITKKKKKTTTVIGV